MKKKPDSNKEIKQNTQSFSVNSILGKVAAIIILPFLVFIIGGSWLVETFSLSVGIKALFVVLYIVITAVMLIYFFNILIKHYYKDKNIKFDVKYDSRDYDFYEKKHKKK